jgi:molecular chaperone DnaJ
MEQELMAIKNYYAILGVARDETPSGIRAAYRDAVRRTHPDYAGSQSAPAFEAVVEAHSVLSDPNRRRDYNERLRREERDRKEPGLLHPFARGWAPRSIFADRDAVHPSFEALAERLRRNFTGRHVPRAERPEELSIEVILTPEEAVRGGILSIGIPVHEICGVCEGTGRNWLFSCPKCGGEGRVSRLQPLPVPIPPELRLGVVPEVSLEALGISNLFVKLRMRVSKESLY